MTTQINANLKDVAALDTLTTLDGRTIKVNSFTVLPQESPNPAIDLSDVALGDRFLLCNGDTVEYVGPNKNFYRDTHPYFFKDVTDGSTYSYTSQGIYPEGANTKSKLNLKEKLTSYAIDLSKAQVGDQYVTGDGKIFKLTKTDNCEPYPYVLERVDGLHAGAVRTYTRHGIHYLLAAPDSVWNLVKKVEAPKAPRVDISAARLGDTLLLRDGTSAVISSIDEACPQTGRFYCKAIGWFLDDGRLKFDPSNEAREVVKLIPATRISLEERITAKIRSIASGKVTNVTVSINDWRRFFGSTSLEQTIEGVSVTLSSSVPDGTYRIQFAFED